MDFRHALVDLARRLNEENVRWALIGGVAMAFNGVARTTFDIDILVEMDDLDGLDRVLGSMDCDLEYRWDESSHFTSRSEGHTCPIDILHAHRPHSRGMLERAEAVPLTHETVVVPVVKPEDLIGLKVQAMVNDRARERQELADIRALLEAVALAKRCFDVGRVREYFELFGRGEQLDHLLEGFEDAFS